MMTAAAWTLRLVGELDHAAAQTVMPGIEDAVEEYLPRRCVLDLTGVSFMDSSGIAVILKTDRLLRQTAARWRSRACRGRCGGCWMLRG